MIASTAEPGAVELPVVKRGPGRPPGSKNKNGSAAAKKKKKRLQQTRRLIGRPCKWQKKWSTDGHLDVFKWVPVEGTEGKYEELPAFEEPEFPEFLEEDPLPRRARVARSTSLRNLGELDGDSEGEGGEGGEVAAAASPMASSASAATQPLPQPEYRCPLCGMAPLKRMGLFTHTRVKHGMARSQLDMQACLIGDAAAKVESSTTPLKAEGMLVKMEGAEPQQQQQARLLPNLKVRIKPLGPPPAPPPQ